jgi:hypothetical protein
MSRQTARMIGLHAVVYLSLAATGMAIGWNQSRALRRP